MTIRSTYGMKDCLTFFKALHLTIATNWFILATWKYSAAAATTNNFNSMFAWFPLLLTFSSCVLFYTFIHRQWIDVGRATWTSISWLLLREIYSNHPGYVEVWALWNTMSESSLHRCDVTDRQELQLLCLGTMTIWQIQNTPSQRACSSPK